MKPKESWRKSKFITTASPSNVGVGAPALNSRKKKNWKHKSGFSYAKWGKKRN